MTVDGVARTGQARVNANSHYARMRDVRHFQDSLIADATAARADLLVTDDRRLAREAHDLGNDVWTSAELLDWAKGRRARRRHHPLRGEQDPPGAGRGTCRTRSRRRTRASGATAGRSGWKAAPSRAVDAHGKHLFIRFENGLTIHCHLRMTGKWRVRDAGDRQTPRNTWLIIRRGNMLVAQINGPVLELMTDSRTRFDRRLAGLGPDILAPELDEAGVLRRLREDDPTRPIGDALLDQRILAGIGNLWKAEGCFDAGIDPWRRTGDVSDEEVLAILRATRPRMQQSAARRDAGALQGRLRHAPARPCPRCGEAVKDPGTRAGRRQPHDILVSTMSALRRDRTQGRGPDRPRATRPPPSTPRSRTAWT